VSYRLLDAFRQTFEGTRYLHRNSGLGDFIAMHLYEDLYVLAKSARLVARIAAHERVVNTRNQRRGVIARRGDGTFGEIVPGVVVAAIRAGGAKSCCGSAMVRLWRRNMASLGTKSSPVFRFRLRPSAGCAELVQLTNGGHLKTGLQEPLKRL
jgi:hypothetical protein